MTISGERTEQLDIFCHVTWLYERLSQFHRCGTYSVLSRSPSITRISHQVDVQNTRMPHCLCFNFDFQVAMVTHKATDSLITTIPFHIYWKIKSKVIRQLI